MTDLVWMETPLPPPATVRIDPACLEIRRAHFPDQISFHTPGLKLYKTSEYTDQEPGEYVSISLTGTACALSCEHCKMSVLRGMADLGQFDGTLFEICKLLAGRGARGVLISGGSDRLGRVPLLQHVPDLVRIREELKLTIRVHTGLPDERTCRALGEVDLDGAMIEVIGHRDTIQQVYHLASVPEDYEHALAQLERHGVPAIPHIILGLHFGGMLGEWRALEMVAAHPPKLLVLVILMPLTGTPMAGVQSPSADEIGAYFEFARKTMPDIPIMLGCARPLGPIKAEIDSLAIDAGLNGIAYPAEGMVGYARQRGLEPQFINACCGVTW
ncbi:MAG: radical SAM protein [Anaerolineales bacterium]